MPKNDYLWLCEYFFHLIGVAAGLMVLSCKPAPDRFDLAEFRHPSATYRSMSFWSLNDSLSADEMRRQLALFNIPPSRRPYSRGLKVESDGGIVRNPHLRPFGVACEAEHPSVRKATGCQTGIRARTCDGSGPKHHNQELESHPHGQSADDCQRIRSDTPRCSTKSSPSICRAQNTASASSPKLPR